MSGKAYSAHGGMLHLNGNLLCAVDVETTGVQAGYHEVIQLAVLPLDSYIKPLKHIMPFYLNIRPEFPERRDYMAGQVTKIDMAELMLTGVDRFRAVDLFMEWFERLNLPVTSHDQKRIAPLWSNGSFDKSFIMELLGYKLYNQCFYFQERDTQAFALSINDRFYQHHDKVPFPKVGVGYLASCFDVVNEKAHDALSDCRTTAEIYRRMLMMYQPVMTGAEVVDGPEVSFASYKKKQEALDAVDAERRLKEQTEQQIADTVAKETLLERAREMETEDNAKIEAQFAEELAEKAPEQDFTLTATQKARFEHPDRRS